MIQVKAAGERVIGGRPARITKRGGVWRPYVSAQLSGVYSGEVSDRPTTLARSSARAANPISATSVIHHRT
jgi:hypothetical protein